MPYLQAPRWNALGSRQLFQVLHCALCSFRQLSGPSLTWVALAPTMAGNTQYSMLVCLCVCVSVCVCLCVARTARNAGMVVFEGGIYAYPQGCGCWRKPDSAPSARRHSLPRFRQARVTSKSLPLPLPLPCRAKQQRPLSHVSPLILGLGIQAIFAFQHGWRERLFNRQATQAPPWPPYHMCSFQPSASMSLSVSLKKLSSAKLQYGVSPFT